MAEVLCCVAETGTVVLFATHDLGFAAGLTAECWRLSEGVVTRGPSLDCAALRSGTGGTALRSGTGASNAPATGLNGEGISHTRVSTPPTAPLNERVTTGTEELTTPGGER